MKKLIIGFTGEMSSGKGTATTLLKTWYPNTPSVRYSDSLREFYAWMRNDFLEGYPLLSGLKEEASTAQLQALSTKLRELFGENTLERAIMARVGRFGDDSPIIIIEGIRRLVDITTLMKDDSVKFRLVYVEAQPAVRYHRHLIRNEKPGDNELTFAQFLALGSAEAEAQIRHLRYSADAIIDNSGTKEEFAPELKAVMSVFLEE